jgi:hypothetical protein
MDWTLDNHQAIGRQLAVKLRKTKMHHLTIEKVTTGLSISDKIKEDAEAVARVNQISTTWRSLAPKPAISSGPGPGRRMREVADEMGLAALYYGQVDNSKRNDAKTKLLESSSDSVYLLALTGNSYLSATGAHAGLVETFLKKPTSHFVAILRDPFSEAGIKTLLNWIRASRTISIPDSEIPRHIVHFTKLRAPLENYFRRLRRTFKERIAVRMTRLDTSCTLLCNDTQCFVEPYFEFDEENRRNVKLDTYELLLSRSTNGARASLMDWLATPISARPPVLSHLAFFQQHSCEVEKWLSTCDRQRQHADLSVQLLLDTDMISQDDASVLQNCLDELSASLKGL